MFGLENWIKRDNLQFSVFSGAKYAGTVTCMVVILVAVVSVAFCPEGRADDPAAERVKIRAEALLTAIREKRWNALTQYTVIGVGRQDDAMKSRLGILPGADQETINQKVGAWFRGIYEALPPGPIRNVRFDENDSSKAMVEYRHGDLDGFYMLRISGEWYYSVI